ncbi:MAG: hypothetical protein IJA08_05305 [Clostridia bacterium]|nr:hypothetical protein [Clostridia bacterium]
MIQKGRKKCASLCDDVYGCYYQLPTPSAGVPFVSAKGTKTSRRRAQIMHFYSARRRLPEDRNEFNNLLLSHFRNKFILGIVFWCVVTVPRQSLGSLGGPGGI